MTTFRSLTLVVAVLLLAGGALTGIHLLHTNTSAPLPAQLSTSDAGGQPGSVPPVEQIPPAAPQVTPTAAAPVAPSAPKKVPSAPAPAQRPTTTAPGRTPASDGGSDHGHGADGWHDPDGFPRRDQYPFRPREGFGQYGTGFGNRPGQTQNSSTTPATPTGGDQARQQVANAICDRYHIPREHCQIEPAGE